MYDATWGHPTPPERPKRKQQWRGVIQFLAALAVVVAGVGTWVMLNRLSEDVLTVVATVGCAAGVSLPGLLLALIVLVKRAESNGRQERPQPQMTQPMMMVVPPMALPPAQAQPQGPAATWEQAPMSRRFVVVGDGTDAE